ncbi:hypothetical protein BZL29_7614 [Mycobacterium kansasii]|uniref:Alpha/beta hydrolase family protein n=1 Tax=Mycobacterium kansasii TaxID=1768 RepID=A0A1V3WGS5_MYCKA|nr:hypothetical protein BZL29_7614 [Mycobacterium kansasii]
MSEKTLRSSTRVIGFDDPELDFQLLRQLGSAAYGGASVGECLAVAGQIRGTGARGWSDAFAQLADRQCSDATQRATAGHRISARDRYLHAANSYRAAEYFSPFGTARHAELGLASRTAFLAAMTEGCVDVEELWLPWRGQRLPGYWFVPPGSSGPGPTLVATSGFDGTLEETYFQIGAAALERGWRVLLICGPARWTRREPNPARISCPIPKAGWLAGSTWHWADRSSTRNGSHYLVSASVVTSSREPLPTNAGFGLSWLTHPSSTCVHT